MMIINDDSRVVNKLEASLIDNVRVIIYDCHMFIVQDTGKKAPTFVQNFRLGRKGANADKPFS